MKISGGKKERERERKECAGKILFVASFAISERKFLSECDLIFWFYEMTMAMACDSNVLKRFNRNREIFINIIKFERKSWRNSTFTPFKFNLQTS